MCFLFSSFFIFIFSTYHCYQCYAPKHQLKFLIHENLLINEPDFDFDYCQLFFNCSLYIKEEKKKGAFEEMLILSIAENKINASLLITVT